MSNHIHFWNPIAYIEDKPIAWLCRHCCFITHFDNTNWYQKFVAKLSEKLWPK